MLLIDHLKQICRHKSICFNESAYSDYCITWCNVFFITTSLLTITTSLIVQHPVLLKWFVDFWCSKYPFAKMINIFKYLIYVENIQYIILYYYIPMYWKMRKKLPIFIYWKMWQYVYSYYNLCNFLQLYWVLKYSFFDMWQCQSSIYMCPPIQLCWIFVTRFIT